MILSTCPYSTITELAAAEKINASYLCRVLMLTLLAPVRTAVEKFATVAAG